MKRRFLAGLLTALLLLTLAACGGSDSASSSSGSTSSASRGDSGSAEQIVENFSPSASMDMAATESAPMEPMEDAGFGGGDAYDTAESESQENGQTTGQKLIRTARLEMETTAFDEAAQALTELTEEFDGYFENSSVANRKSGARWADYTVRVPAERFNAFLSQAGELCHLTWQEVSQDDVSEVYYDTAGRLKTQQIKLERLQALLAQAELMEDIITIESAISETEWQIDELSGTLRHYDGKVNYATVYINISEVYKFSDVEEVPDSFGARMSAAFSGGMATFADNLENLAVGFAYSWMWWLLVIVIAAAVVWLVRRRWRKTEKDVRRPPFWNPRVERPSEKSEDDKAE